MAEQARIMVLGAGVMGSAMTVPAARHGHDIALVGTHLDTDIIRMVDQDGHHPKLKLRLSEQVKAHQMATFGEAMTPAPDLIILGVASAGVDWAIAQLAGAMETPVPILMITKGMAVRDGTIETLPHKVARALKDRLGFTGPVMAVAGPAIAGEQAASRPTNVVFTGFDDEAVKDAQKALATEEYHITRSDDVIGIEVCAAFKNFFALAVGTAAGALEHGPAVNGALMHNAAAGLFTQSVHEMRLLVEALGGKPDTVGGLAGTGDLYVTCQAGRNSRMGRLLGLGIPYAEAKAEHMASDTVEGADLALAVGPTLRAMFADGRLNKDRMPLTRAILDTVCDNETFGADWSHFHA
ncbi:MAG: glycerol-3-phosphate dehydrogenase [Pseudomonadota bacterium]